MKQAYPALFYRMVISLLLLGCSTHLEAVVSCKLVNEGQGSLIRIFGRMEERSTHRPLKDASVMVRSGQLTLANKSANDKGEFEFYIPAEKIGEKRISVSIQYMGHIFRYENLRPVSQDLLIEINGAILLEKNPISAYSMPIHRLGQPEVGHVYIRG